jgi:hypothetical protein
MAKKKRRKTIWAVPPSSPRVPVHAASHGVSAGLVPAACLVAQGKCAPAALGNLVSGSGWSPGVAPLASTLDHSVGFLPPVASPGYAPPDYS